MAGIQVLTRGHGGTIETQFLDRQVASCVVTVYTGDGGAKVTAAACTVDPLSTTLSAGVSAGDRSIPLASATNCFVGRRYLIGAGPGTTQIEETVSVKSLSSSTAVLWAPLISDHAVGTTVKGVRVSYAYPAGSADTTWVNGFADFDPQDGSEVQTEHVECYLRKIPEKGCDETDLRAVFADAPKALSENMDLPGAIKQARDRFLYDLGGKNRAHAFIGADIFRQLVAMKFWLLRRLEFGPDWAPALDKLQDEYTHLKEQVQLQNPADNDQDGATNGGDDGGFVCGTVSRA